MPGSTTTPDEFLADEVGARPKVTPEALFAVLKKARRTWTLRELSDHFNVGISRIEEAARTLHDKRINLHFEAGALWLPKTAEADQSSETVIDLSATLSGARYQFGATADNHLGSKYERLDVLNAMFDYWADIGVTAVYQGGNMIEGEARFNRQDVAVFGLDAQVEYFLENWPQRKGITTYFLTGDDHEGWYAQRELINIGRYIQDRARAAGRDDLVYVGHMEHDFVLKAEHGEARMRLMHGGGGSSYAYSYTMQKYCESLQGGEKPKIVLCGHYHKFDHCYPREVHCVQLGCTTDQSTFMRKRKIEGHLGAVTVSFTQSQDGLIHHFAAPFDPFYDRDFYQDTNWRFIWEQNDRLGAQPRTSGMGIAPIGA